VLKSTETLSEYKNNIKVSNLEIAKRFNHTSKVIVAVNMELSNLFLRVIDRVNNNYRKSREEIINQIHEVTGFSDNRFTRLLSPEVEFSPRESEIKVLEWLLSYDIKDFPREIKIDYKVE
jgi:hypothetical protein